MGAAGCGWFGFRALMAGKIPSPDRPPAALTIEGEE